jgi:broad specificity phosphatase PhoE
MAGSSDQRDSRPLAAGDYRLAARPWQHHPPGGERLEQVQTRIFAAVDAIVARHPDGLAAVFCHKLPIALLKIRYQGHPADDIWSLLPANGAWEVFNLTA